MRKSFFSIFHLLLFLFVVQTGFAQFQPGINMNVIKHAQMDNYNTYSNLWGYIDSLGREYVLLGHNAGTSIINITDPANPVEIDMIPGTSPSGSGTIWREMKTFGKYLYIVSEHSSPNALSGLQIVDLSLLPDTAIYVKRVLWPGVTQSNARAHTISIDSAGYITLNGGSATLGGANQGGIRIFSLADPLNPQSISTFDPRYVHDSFIKDSLLFAHNIFEFPGHIDVLNISDRNNPSLVTSHIYPNGFSHNSWITEDRNILISSDEEAGLTIKIWDVSRLWDNNTANDDSILLVGEYLGAAGSIAHEPRIRAGFCYISHYKEGLKIIDIQNPAAPVEVGYYDTYPSSGGSFSGAWGNWPFFPSGTVAVSDISNGLFLLGFNNKRASGIQGVVYEKGTTNPLSGVTLRFLEANKTITTSAQGTFSFKTAEGTHRIIASRSNYFTDTITVNLTAGPGIIQNLYLNNSLVEIEVNSESLTESIRTDSTASKKVIIKNLGTQGSLFYNINAVDDISSLNQSKISTSLALDLPWISLSKNQGILTANQSDTVIVNFLSSGLTSDSSYAGTLVITSNDADEDTLLFPITLNVLADPTGLHELAPLSFGLNQNYPNPFNPVTFIAYTLPSKSHVQLKVYDITGDEVASLQEGVQEEGIYLVRFGAEHLATGIYFYTLRTGDFTSTRKMVLIK